MGQIGTTILITSAGRRAGLLSCFRSAAQQLGVDLRIVACDLDPSNSAACGLADVALAVPPCGDAGYVQAVLDAVRKYDVSLVVPTIDPELLPFARQRDAFRAAGARVHVSDVETILVARDKAQTSAVFGAAGVAVPRTFSEQELRSDTNCLTWPVFAKPSGGSASRGLQLIHHPDELPDAFVEPMIFQDHLQGPEFTINMFVDCDGTLQTVVPHLRMQVRGGEVEKGRTMRRDDLHEMAQGIAMALPGLRGVACFQIIDDPNQGPRVIEINARFGGGYPLADHAGACFAQWLLEERLDLPRTANDDWRDGVLMLRYDSAVYHG